MAATALAVAATGAASAANVDVYITGSSAFRGAVVQSITELLGPPPTGTGTAPYGAFEASASGSNAVATSTDGSFAGSSQQLIVGVPNSTGTTAGLSASNTYYFHTCWTGSLGGITTLAYNLTPQKPTPPGGAAGSVSNHAYLPDTVTIAPLYSAGDAQGATTYGGESLGDDETTIDKGATGGTRAADAAFSDVFQTSTQFTSPSLTGATVAGSGSTANTDGIVGVVPFVFVANPDLSNYVPAGTASAINTSFTTDNMTATNARALYSAAGLNIAQITGNTGDYDQSVGQIVATGRDADSGTRFTTFAETGFNPIGGTNPPTQYQVATNGIVSKFPAQTLFVGTTAATSYGVGASGYSSGKNERNALAVNGTSTSSSHVYVVGSLGESDAITIVKVGGTAAPSYMAYNGVGYATSPTATSTSPFNRTLLEQGEYTFWGYEHCYLDPSTANATVINAIAARVRSTDAPIAGDSIMNMAVQRDSEGAAISYVGVGNSSQ